MVPQTVSAPPRRRDVRCVECALTADTTAGWKAFLTGGFDDEPVEIVVYCPACAEREVDQAG
jgi:hypothetical protein